MNGIITFPDERLQYVSHKEEWQIFTIHVESTSLEAKCPYCGEMSKRVHSRYLRKLQDLPIQGKKVRLIIENKKYFCFNNDCGHKTFAEPFLFFKPKATKTTRLQEEILRVSLTQSSVSAATYLKRSVADVGKSTICNLLKKTRRDD